jgi:glutamine synthetase
MSFAEHLAAFRARHPDIEVAEVYVSDLNGVARGKLIPFDMLGKLTDGGMKLPVSVLGLDIFGCDVPESGIALETGDPDGNLIPVDATLAPMRWAGRPTAQLQCMMTGVDGQTVCGYDPRGVLARVTERAHAMGYQPVMALELEFYLIDPVEPLPPINPVAGGRLDRAQIYDMEVMRSFEPVMAGITRAAQALGAPAETAICEFGAGQFEMNLRHVADPLAAADHLIGLKRAVRGVARGHGLDATFMPKPYGTMAGSGMHIHLSLLDDKGRNIFDGKGKGPNAAAKQAVAGMLDNMVDSMLMFAPHHNSYRRFIPGSYAPIVAAWGLDNRSVPVRMPEVAGKGARIEHRVSGSDANPYLLAASVLAAALDGLERRARPPAPVGREAGEDDGEALPLSWVVAEQRFTESEFIENWLGAEFQRVYSAMKRQERATLLERVSDVEYGAYLRTV